MKISEQISLISNYEVYQALQKRQQEDFVGGIEVVSLEKNVSVCFGATDQYHRNSWKSTLSSFRS
jgi:hypothetical protein